MTKDKTLCFVFSPDLKHVYLLRKNKPKWQEDYLNGVGGKVEKGESFKACILRETEEEIGVLMDRNTLYDIGVIEAKEWRVRIYAYKLGKKQKPKQMEDEELNKVLVKNVPKLKVIPNLRMLIPYSQYVLEGKEINVREYMASTLIIKFR